MVLKLFTGHFFSLVLSQELSVYPTTELTYKLFKSNYVELP